MNARLRRPAAPRLIPWGNGGGESRELLAGPGWRISTTWIERDCAFSHYPGKRRRIALMQGAGFRLEFVGQPGIAVAEPGESAEFLGAWNTTCHLVAGRVEVLNLILEDSLLPPTLGSVGEGEARLGPHARALFCASGSARAGEFEMKAGELLAADPGTTLSVRLARASLLLEIGLPA